MLAGLFREPSCAENAYQRMFSRGYGLDEIIVVMPESTWQGLFSSSAQDASLQPQHGRINEGTRNGNPESGHPDMGGDCGPTAIPISSAELAPRVMAVGRVATALKAMNQRPGEGLAEALAACGIPVGLAQRCTAGIEQGKILLGVIPRNTADANALADDWAREKGDVIAR